VGAWFWVVVGLFLWYYFFFFLFFSSQAKTTALCSPPTLLRRGAPFFPGWDQRFVYCFLSRCPSIFCFPSAPCSPTPICFCFVSFSLSRWLFSPAFFLPFSGWTLLKTHLFWVPARCLFSPLLTSFFFFFVYPALASLTSWIVLSFCGPFFWMFDLLLSVFLWFPDYGTWPPGSIWPFFACFLAPFRGWFSGVWALFIRYIGVRTRLFLLLYLCRLASPSRSFPRSTRHPVNSVASPPPPIPTEP